MTSDDLKRVARESLSARGFAGRGVVWRRNDDKVSQVVEFQRSNYSALYYLNVGVWLDAVTERKKDFPPHKCHIRFRADGVIGREKEIATTLDLENTSLSDSEREEKIRGIISEVVDFLDSVKSESGLAAALQTGRFQDALVAGAAREHLQRIDSPVETKPTQSIGVRNTSKS